MKTKVLFAGLIFIALSFTIISFAQSVPPVVNYQGRVSKAGMPYDGPGVFKFAVCSQFGTTTYWSNDGTSTNCNEPAGGLSIPVDNGIYHIGLGDVNIPGMVPLSPSVFQNNNLFLSVWFGDTVSSIERLLPAQPITSVPYAMQAENARTLEGLTPGELGGREPNVIVVALSGGDTTTIAGGLLLADTISPAVVRVAPGIYMENNLMVTKDITLQCIRPRSCVVDAGGGMCFTIMGDDNIRIQGFEIRNSWEGIHLSGGETNIEITDNIFKDCDRGVNMMGGDSVREIYIRHNVFQAEMAMSSYGVRLMSARNAWIEDNIFEGLNGGDGRAVWIEESGYLRVRNNKVSNIEGMIGGISSGVGMIDCNTVWIENNTMSNLRGSSEAAIYCENCMAAHIRHNDISGLNLMFGGTTDGIYAQLGSNILIEGNGIRNLRPPQSAGIRLRDVGDYRVVDNKINLVGDPWMAGGPAWGVKYENRSGVMPGPGSNKQIIMDNHITGCDNGLSLDYTMMEWEPYSEKEIKGNIILDGDSMGPGILLKEVRNIQVLENKVVNYEKGLEAVYMMVDPDPLHVMRNELWKNSWADLELVNVMTPGGTIRVFYNFMDNYNRPMPGPAVYEGFNINSTGGTP
jgi:nitrous oxidase accessory protein NosD